jgi:MOSC domain-containing protein YiiM
MDHKALATLEAGIETVRGAPLDGGRVELIVRRPHIEAREVVTEATLDEDEGLVGDSWLERAGGAEADGDAHRETQITVMNARTAQLIAGDRERWPLAGDQFYVDLDLSAANLPPGTRLQIGAALLEVTAEPHRGCGKFSRRFGVDALKFVNSGVGRELNLRGINARIVRGGVVRIGDRVYKTTGE